MVILGFISGLFIGSAIGFLLYAILSVSKNKIS